MAQIEDDEEFKKTLEETNAMVRQYVDHIELLATTTEHVIDRLSAPEGKPENSITTKSAGAQQAVQSLLAKAPDLEAVANTKPAPNTSQAVVGMVLENAVTIQQLLGVLAQAVATECVAQIYSMDSSHVVPPPTAKGKKKAS